MKQILYRETLDYLFNRLPMFQRVGAAAYKADLGNTIALCKILENPERNFPSVHIAGTNGKGSVSNMIASILQEAGYKTGLFTSPHLKDFRERIRVNGTMVSEDFIVDFVRQYKDYFESVGASFFEYTFAMAMQYFFEQKIDIAVVETGMGGRLDSTNIILPVVTAITNIGLDHTEFLGKSIRKIAAEKAGIIKPEVPIVIGEMQEEIMDVFMERAMDSDAPLTFADNGFAARFNNDGLLNIMRDGEPFLYNLSFPLQGKYQEKNVVTAMEIVAVLKRQKFNIPKKNMKTGLERVIQNTGFAGRWQVLGSNPATIFDTAHNAAGIDEVMRQLSHLTFHQLHIVLGMVGDKDISNILALFPKDAVYYFCKADIPRGLDAHILERKAQEHNLYGRVYTSVNEAFEAAKQVAKKEDVIFVGGSTFTVAEAI
ncbi:MAG: bifunctional folylpolyglutamate synthase/dihydrofolate synthase [Bacteroidales bacterium]|jgi:dihydrofolate synthase/folylpolyglutamate synthase|nr:bifunctional folylpolyglutamate synthase/dihydrofolate synthase [Bacteroidales bacterium]